MCPPSSALGMVVLILMCTGWEHDGRSRRCTNHRWIEFRPSQSDRIALSFMQAFPQGPTPDIGSGSRGDVVLAAGSLAPLLLIGANRQTVEFSS